MILPKKKKYNSEEYDTCESDFQQGKGVPTRPRAMILVTTDKSRSKAKKSTRRI